MSTVYTPGFTFGLGGASGLPPPQDKSKPAQRFYICELKPFGWQCEPSPLKNFHKEESNILATKLISVPEYLPSFFERPYVYMKMKQMSVVVNK